MGEFDDARPAEPDEGCSSAVPAGSGYDVDDDTGYRSEAEFPSDSSDAEEEDGPDDVEDVAELAFGSDLASCRGEEDVYPREDGQYVVACDEFAQEMHAAASGSSPAKFVPSKNGFYIKRWGGAASE